MQVPRNRVEQPTVAPPGADDVEVLEEGFTQRRKVREGRKELKMGCHFAFLSVLAALRELY
jgi:hypothetical protein